MPPSATAKEYDAGYAHALMEDLNMSSGGALKRAVLSLVLCGLGAFTLIAVLTYNPFDTTGDTAGIGQIQNMLGRPGANLLELQHFLLFQSRKVGPWQAALADGLAMESI